MRVDGFFVFAVCEGKRHWFVAFEIGFRTAGTTVNNVNSRIYKKSCQPVVKARHMFVIRLVFNSLNGHLFSAPVAKRLTFGSV